MGKETSILVTLCLLVGFIHSSQEYGTKGGHRSFTQSYSSASASAQSSSFSSSGSYSFGDKSILPIIGPLPIAKSTAIASASAGAATAVAGAGALAAVGYQKNVAGSSPSVISGSGGYQVGANSQGHTGKSGSYQNTNDASKPCCDNIRPGDGSSIHDQKIPSTGTITGGYSVPSGGKYESPSISIESVPSSKEKETNENTSWNRPPCCKKVVLPGPDGSIHDYKVPITDINTISQSSSGTSGYSGVSTISGTSASSKPISLPSSGNQQPSSTTFSGYGQPNAGTFISNAATAHSNAHGQISSGSGYGVVQQPTQGISSATDGKKPCCKGPFPGPNGSIHDSKPASAVGTAVKQEPITTQIPLHRRPVNFPGPSGSIYSSKPVKTIGTSEYGRPNINTHPINNPPDQYTHTEKAFGSHQSSGVNSVSTVSNSVPSNLPSISSNTILKPAEGYRPTNPDIISVSSVSSLPSSKPLEVYGNKNVYQSTSNGGDSYHTQYQGSTEYKPPCTQGPCSKEPPRTYLEPPQDQVKPVVEIIREKPNSVPIAPTAPSSYGGQVSGINTGYTTEKIAHASGSSAFNNVKLQGEIAQQMPSYTQFQDHQIAVNGPSTGLQKQNTPGYHQGGITSSSTTVGSSATSTYSATGGEVKIHKTFNGPVEKPTDSSQTIINEDQRKKDEGTTLYVSQPGSATYTTGTSTVYNSPVTENTILGGGLHEGPRGSPFAPTNNPGYGSRTNDYDDSAIVFIDGQRKIASGGYPSGRGFSSSTGYVFTGQGVAGNTESKNIYNSQKTDESEKDLSYSQSSEKTGNEGTGIYKSTIYIDLKNPGHSGQQAVYSGSGILSSDNYKSNRDNAASSGSYSSSSVRPCKNNRCVTSYKQNSNAEPSGNKDIGIPRTSISSGSGGSYSSSGSYGGGALNYGSVYVGKSDNFGGYGTSIGSGYGKKEVSSGSGLTGQGVIIVGTSTIDNTKSTGANTGSYSTSGGYSSSSGLPCNSHGCGTSYRQYSNAVPSAGNKNIAVHITTIPSGATGSYSSGGSYGGGTHNYGSVYAGKNDGSVGSYGSSQISIGTNKAGSAAGSYSANAGDSVGTGGFLSSIFLDDGTSANSGAYGAAGSFSHASSYSKASSHASSSSFSSASSGSYSSGHY